MPKLEEMLGEYFGGPLISSCTDPVGLSYRASVLISGRRYVLISDSRYVLISDSRQY